MNIGENIKKYRLKNCLTQESLAAVVGVTAQAVSKWECLESIPDGMLFIPIADALGISIDTLCGHNKPHEVDAYRAIIKLIENTTKEDAFKKVREICWQTQKGLFDMYMKIDTEYVKGEMESHTNASSVCNDNGFTFISNRSELPFFSVFPEPENGYGNIIKYDEKYRLFFEAFSDEYVMKAFFWLYSQDNGFIFEKEYLAGVCDIPDDKINDVMNKLQNNTFSFRSINECEINDEKRTLYTLRQRYEIVALFAMLNELVYFANSFDLQTCYRNNAFLK